MPADEVNVTLPPEQKVVGLPLIVGTEGEGFTVTSTVIGELVQPLAVAVIVYLTTAEAIEVLVSVWAITGPDPALKPAVEDPENNAALQEKVAPIILLVSWILILFPEQTVWDVGLAVNERVWPGITVTLLVLEHPVEVIVSTRVYVVVTAGVTTGFERLEVNPAGTEVQL